MIDVLKVFSDTIAARQFRSLFRRALLTCRLRRIATDQPKATKESHFGESELVGPEGSLAAASRDTGVIR